jgi:hypothetical protein
MRYDTLHSISVGEGLGWFRNVIGAGVSSLTMGMDEEKNVAVDQIESRRLVTPQKLPFPDRFSSCKRHL